MKKAATENEADACEAREVVTLDASQVPQPLVSKWRAQVRQKDASGHKVIPSKNMAIKLEEDTGLSRNERNSQTPLLTWTPRSQREVRKYKDHDDENQYDTAEE